MKKIFIPAIALVMGLASCDMLNTVPESTLAPENYFRTETDLQLFSNTFYNNLLTKEPFKSQSDLNVQNQLSAILMGGDQRTIPATGGGWTWTNLRKMNTLLGHIDQCNDEKAVAKYTGVTKFFRAYFYFDKLTRFGEVPWIDRELGSADEALFNPRDSRDVILGHMIEDIDDAIAKLPENVSVYRVNKWAALTLKAQFCLFEGTWRKYHANDAYAVKGEGVNPASYYLGLAAEAAEAVINSGKYSLASDYRQLFANVDADPKEFILAIKNDFSLQIFNDSFAYATQAQRGAPGLTKKFIDSFLMADGTRFTDQAGYETMQFAAEVAGRDPRLAAIIRTPGYKHIGGNAVLPPELGCSVTGFQYSKFVQDCTLEGVTRADRSTNDIPVYRYAEVLLMYAEAKAELGELTQDIVDQTINALRRRAGMTGMLTLAGLTVDPYLTSAQFGYQSPVLLADPNCAAIVEIRRERTVELALEGRRWNDLMRWAEGKCIEQPIYGMYFPGPGEYDLDGDGVNEYCLYTGSKPATSATYVYKIGSLEDGGITLTEGNSGYILRHVVVDANSSTGFKEIDRTFNESRDYLYPIPSQEFVLNTNLKQNIGW